MESTLVDIALGGIITWILFQTWMNLWPLKKGPYDPLTYDVRRTISVRIMLHGPWLEMRFPKRNLPLRRMYNDKEPSNVQFHEHVEVIDLSTCSIDLQPDNLPTKRIWSKVSPFVIFYSKINFFYYNNCNSYHNFSIF